MRLPPSLLPLLPMVYMAWADRFLTPGEAARIRDLVQNEDWLDAETREALASWLDPDAPPDAAELNQVLVTIRQLAAGLPDLARLSLAELGVELAKAGGARDGAPRPAALEALRSLEDALGLAGHEASRALLDEAGIRAGEALTPRKHALARGPRAETRLEEPAFDVQAMNRLLDGEQWVTRRQVLELLSGPEFQHQPDLGRAEYRERVWSWCRQLAVRGWGALAYPREYGGGDLARAIAVFETLAFHDLSLTTKFGVQFGLFGGSILGVGTRSHHERYLRDVGTLALPGCFAMTETGHGSNVRDVETVARYDVQQQEFVIDTPSESARKDYIGGAALHAHMATVFAQLEVNGAAHGVHVFLVPLRDARGRPLPGVRIEDCGDKPGLNGVDNGRISFFAVRIPRENLLDRFGQVSPDGVYTSPIASPSRRFFTMLGTLVAGRVSIAAAALSVAKTGLTIAVRYGAARRQFGPAGSAELPILDYLDIQQKLMPRLATAYALDFAVKHLVRRLIDRSDDDAREVEVLAAALKAYTSRFAVDTLQCCREACGGQGYLSLNRIGPLRADADVFTTFEGANPVLLQLVAKGLLTEYRTQVGELGAWGVVRYLAGRASTALTELNPVVTRKSDDGHLRDPDFQLDALRYREERLLGTVARRLKSRIDDGLDSFAAMNECQDHLIALANAHVERLVLERFHEAVDGCVDEALRAVLTTLRDLFALSRIHADRGWFLENGYIEGGKAKAIRNLVNRLCGEVRRQAPALVDAFGIPDAVLGAPIATRASRG